jgi:hypothetical protein
MSVQTNTSSSSTGNTTSSSTSSNTTITTDFDIFGVGNGINTSNYVYDGQTVLLVNSTSSQGTSSVKGTFFDPTQSSNVSWTLSANSNMSCNIASQALLNTNYDVMQNVLPIGLSVPTYTLDLLNTGVNTNTNTTSNDSSGNNYYTTTMALLANTYSTTTGVFNGGLAPTNTEPSYPTNSNSASYMFTGNYYFTQTTDIVIAYMVYTINGTDLLSNTALGQGTPTLSVMVYNRVISKESIAKGDVSGKLYTAGPISLSFMPPSTSFSNNASYQNTTNFNIPIIIADNCQKIYGTISVAYVPYSDGFESNGGYYLNRAGYNYSNGVLTPEEYPGLAIIGGATQMNTTIGEGIVNIGTGNVTTSGHFVVGLTYPIGNINYAGINIYCDLLIKNIWRSPVSIYNTYSSYSISDLAVKQVVLLFGKSSNGATFLVTNSGTPINIITSYAVTSLSNFIGLMNSVISNFNSTSSLVSFFTDSSTVSTNNDELGLNNVALKTQSLLSGSIINPDSVAKSPNMWYMLLQTTNSANLSVDPTSQKLFNNDIGNYFDLQNSSLCSLGTVNYSGSKLNILTAGSSYLFANSIFCGQTTINNQTFYNLVILPEAQFNGAPTTNAGNISIYAVNNTSFYTATSSTAKSSTRYDENAATSKLMMTASNIDIV